MLALSLGGYLMVGSFATAGSARAAEWRQVGYVYLGIAVLSFGGVVAALRALMRRRDPAEETPRP